MSNPSTPTSIYERSRIRYWLLFTLVGALAAGVVAFWGTNFFGTRDLREIAKAPNGELEWLRQEFHLSDAQFRKIEALHSAYTPVCNEMCQRIMEANSKLDRLLSENREVTPEVEAAITEAGSVQDDCRRQMLAHIYQVSAQMNPADAQNYLRLMKSRVIQPALSSETAVRPTTE
jgi:Heavy-metal resistance